MYEIISLQKINKNFGDKIILNEISFSISENEIFGLLGPSGAGKTTIINILTGQIKKNSGEAKIFGVSCDNIPDNIYSSIGMVLDNIGIYMGLTCYQNLAVFAKIYNINKNEIPKALMMVNLENEAKTKARQLSKGMRQRLAIARAILHKPKLLFFDEPTSGLDPANVLEIHKLILMLRRQGTTVFLTTHNMNEATKLCDNIALLNKGIIVEYGTPNEVCRKYNIVNNISICLKSGDVITLPNNSESAEAIAVYFKNEQVESIHSSEPDLEKVFLTVTDRKQVTE